MAGGAFEKVASSLDASPSECEVAAVVEVVIGRIVEELVLLGYVGSAI